MNNSLSIIVPVYNVEQYVEQCLNSIIKQLSFEDELIIVDDGSTDNSEKLCKNLINNLPNVIYCRQNNSGSSSARNKGIELSSKTYLCFVDSDDYIKDDYVSEIKKALNSSNPDVLMFGYETFPNGSITIPKFKKNAVICPEELFAENYEINKNNEFCFSWRFVLNRMYISNKQIKFDEEVKIGEDYLYNAIALLEANRIYVLDKALYMYRTDNSQSIMRKKYKKNLNSQLQIQYQKKKKIIDTYLLDEKTGWKKDLSYYYINNFRDMLIRNVCNGPNTDRVKKIREVLNLDLITENYKEIGTDYIKGSKRAAIIHFLFKHKCALIVNYLAKHHYFG